MWDVMQHTDIHVVGIPEKRERKKMFEVIMAENFPDLLNKQ